MSTTYYYFGASLPLITFDSKLPFSIEDFLNDCERLLGRKDYQLVDDLLNSRAASSSHPVIAKIAQFELDLGNHIAQFRALKANKEPNDFIKGEFSDNHDIHQLIEEASNASDPLEGEKLISKARWNFYEALLTDQHFTLAYILIYGLKLKIVERYHNIGSPKGREIYEELKKIDFPEGVMSN